MDLLTKELQTDFFLHHVMTNLGRCEVSTKFEYFIEENPAVECTEEAAVSMSSTVNNAVLCYNQ